MGAITAVAVGMPCAAHSPYPAKTSVFINIDAIEPNERPITAKKAVVLCFLRIAENIFETIMIPQTNPKPREANKRIAAGLFRR